MAPSPTPSQNSLEKIKFTPIPATDPVEIISTAPSTTSTPAVTTTSSSSKYVTTASSPTDRSQPFPQQLQQDVASKGVVHDFDDDGCTIVLDNNIEGDEITKLPPPSPNPEENKTWIRFLKCLFYFIVVIVVLVLISSVVAVTVAYSLRNKSDSSSNNTESSSSLAISTTTTFPKPECLPSEYQCPNGQCIPQAARCNKVSDCKDLADEANCTNCDGFQCVSSKVCLWYGMTRRCDGVVDCGDLSDEIGCRFNFRLHRMCRNGVRISKSLWCNGLDDCRDNSDEANCECERTEVSCGSTNKGRCIPQSSRCDGYIDCENGSDEEGCAKCQADEFQCSDLSCIPGKSRCDGTVDCLGGGDEDELGCVDISPKSDLVQILSNNSWIPACSDGWTQEHSAELCRGKRHVHFWIEQEKTSSQYAVIKEGNVKVTSRSFDIRSTCKTGQVVAVRCYDPSCGESKLPALRNAIAGGELPPLGKWPWVAFLAYLDSPVCGAVVIDEGWALTAFHCIMKFYPKDLATNSSTPPYHFTITVGSINAATSIDIRNEKQHPSIRRHVTSIHPHPQSTVLSNGGVDYDLALLKLDKPVKYSDTVQPICLPRVDQVFPPTSVCFLAGWGVLSESQYLKPIQLRDSRLRVWPEAQCQSNTEGGETTVNINSTICAGYPFGLPSGCQGDSGGPLMCLDQPQPIHPTQPPMYRWSLAGILSRTNSFCGKPQPNAMANRFARVSTSIDWIEATIGADEDVVPQPPRMV